MIWCEIEKEKLVLKKIYFLYPEGETHISGQLFVWIKEKNTMCWLMGKNKLPAVFMNEKEAKKYIIDRAIQENFPIKISWEKTQYETK